MKKKPDRYIVARINGGRNVVVYYESYAEHVKSRGEQILASGLTEAEVMEKMAHIRLGEIAARLFPG